MNKKIIKVLILIFIFSLTFAGYANADKLDEKLKGKILLQVELNGEAWYVNPDNLSRYYLGRPADAFNVMRELGLGISNNAFDSFNNIAPERLSGKILIKVEDNGEAYYVNPCDLQMHYLGRPADAFQIMRELGLGITNDNLKKIEIGRLANLEFNKTYISKTGITITVTNIEKVEEEGSDRYIISYKQENKTTDKELSEGKFKMFFKDSTGLNQYGSFGKIFPNESITKTCTFQTLKTQKSFCVEFNDDIDAGLEGSFFRNQPATDTLKWRTE